MFLSNLVHLCLQGELSQPDRLLPLPKVDAQSDSGGGLPGHETERALVNQSSIDAQRSKKHPVYCNKTEQSLLVCVL